MSLNRIFNPPAGKTIPVHFADLTVDGDAKVEGSLDVSGSITVTGPLVELNTDGAAASSIGFYAPRDDLPGPDVYTGLIRDDATGFWYLIDGSATAPPAADLSQKGDLQVKGLVASGLANLQDTTVTGDLGATRVFTSEVHSGSVDAQSVSVEDPAVVVNSSAANQAGIGLYAPIDPVLPGPQYYAGLMREAGDDGKWHLTDGVTMPPPADLSSSHGSLEVDTLTCRILHRVEELKVDDPLFEVNAAAVDDSMAVGFYAQQVPVGPTYYTGLVREPTAKKWYLIDNSTFEPPNPAAYGFLGDFSTAEFKSATADASLEVKGPDITTTGTGTLHVYNDNGLYLQGNGPYVTMQRPDNTKAAIVGITTDSTAEEWGIGARPGDNDFTLYTLGGTMVRWTQGGEQTLTGNSTISGTSALQGATTFGAGGTSYVFPTARGNDGDVLKTDGAGSVNWGPDDIGEIIYKPGAPSSGVVKATWAEVVEYVEFYEGATYVYIDDSVTSPAVIDADIDCSGRAEFYPGSFAPGASTKVSVSAGVRIKNPRAFRGPIEVTCISIGVPTFDLSNGQLVEFVEGASLINDATSTLPCIDVPAGDGIALSISYGGGLSKAGAAAVANVGAGSSLVLAQLVMANPGSLSNDIITSTDGTGTLLMLSDASKIPITNAGFTGILIDQGIDNAAAVNYDDSVVPPLGAGSVQDAIDALKQRPTGQLYSFGGQMVVGGSFARANGEAATTADAAEGVANRQVVAKDGTISVFTYNTTLGDGTTQYTVNVNGVALGSVLGSGAVGASVLNIPVVLGDVVACGYTGVGTIPADSVFGVLVA